MTQQADADWTRTSCAICGSAHLEHILTTAPQPIYQGCVAFERKPDECAPMNWVECSACGSAQISSLPALSRIYQAGHVTGLGAAWARHHAAFAKFVGKKSCGAILDVGGGSGTLAAAYRKSGGHAEWTILEPHALRTPDLPHDVEVIEGFLNADSLRSIGAESVVMCHMLEHVGDMRATVDMLSQTQSCKRVLLAWPDLEVWVRKGLAGALNFEHGIYVTTSRLTALFAEFGWRLEASERWDEGDTWFLSFERGTSAVMPERTKSRDLIQSYYARFRMQAALVTEKLTQHDGDAFLMPASVYAQVLIAHGLVERRFSALLDNAALKQDKRLYGTDLLVAGPHEVLPGARKPLVVFNGGAHEAEVTTGLRNVRPDVQVMRSDSTFVTAG